jgi:hypothetical protein
VKAVLIAVVTTIFEEGKVNEFLGIVKKFEEFLEKKYGK